MRLGRRPAAVHLRPRKPDRDCANARRESGDRNPEIAGDVEHGFERGQVVDVLLVAPQQDGLPPHRLLCMHRLLCIKIARARNLIRPKAAKRPVRWVERPTGESLALFDETRGGDVRDIILHSVEHAVERAESVSSRKQ
jgi:hypothetical protein